MVQQAQSFNEQAAMTDTLTKIANSDTPAVVEVPSTWAGLIVWAAGRFGVGVIFAVVFGYATREVYYDGKERQDQLMNYVIERNVSDSKRAVADSELAKSLVLLSDAVEAMCAEAKRAHANVGDIDPRVRKTP